MFVLNCPLKSLNLRSSTTLSPACPLSRLVHRPLAWWFALFGNNWLRCSFFSSRFLRWSSLCLLLRSRLYCLAWRWWTPLSLLGLVRFLLFLLLSGADNTGLCAALHHGSPGHHPGTELAHPAAGLIYNTSTQH